MRQEHPEIQIGIPYKPTLIFLSHQAGTNPRMRRLTSYPHQSTYSPLTLTNRSIIPSQPPSCQTLFPLHITFIIIIIKIPSAPPKPTQSPLLNPSPTPCPAPPFPTAPPAAPPTSSCALFTSLLSVARWPLTAPRMLHRSQHTQFLTNLYQARKGKGGICNKRARGGMYF